MSRSPVYFSLHVELMYCPLAKFFHFIKTTCQGNVFLITVLKVNSLAISNTHMEKKTVENPARIYKTMVIKSTEGIFTLEKNI